MKKIIAALLVLAVAAPALAVDVTVQQISGTEVKISYDASGEAELVRALGIDVVADSPDVNIFNATDTSADYPIFPGSIAISSTGVITGYGTPIANPDDHPDTQSGPNAVTLEMGSLYASGDPAPADQGDLVVLVMDVNLIANPGLVSNVSMASNNARGGIVLEDGSAGSTYGTGPVYHSTLTRTEYAQWLVWGGGNPANAPANWRGWCWHCGDVTGDGYVSFSDVQFVFNAFKGVAHPAGSADANMDGYESFADVQQVFNLFKTAVGSGCSACQ